MTTAIREAVATPPRVVPRSTAALDLRTAVLAFCGAIVAAIVLPPVQLGLFAANVLVIFWLSRQRWDWVRKYTSFLLLESLYFFGVFHFPRPGPEVNPVFRHLIPEGPYFLLLWVPLEVTLALKLMDFVLCRTDHRDPESFGLGRLVMYVLYPFTLLAGPTIGFEDFYQSRRQDGLRRSDVLYVGKKLIWGALLVFVMAPWLNVWVAGVRGSVEAGTGPAAVLDPRLVMWIWLGTMSILMYLIYKGYTDLMLAASRLSGFQVEEQFRMMLFAKDPVEYWQNSNRGVYRVTTQYIFNRMFDRNRIAPKAMMSTGASGMAHALMCPGMTLPGAFLLTALFGASGLVVAALQRIGRRPISAMWASVPDGTLRNALVIAGVASTFFFMSIPRASFLLFVGGATPAEWLHLMKLLFVRG